LLRRSGAIRVVAEGSEAGVIVLCAGRRFLGVLGTSRGTIPARMPHPTPASRRRFLKSAAAAALAPMIVPPAAAVLRAADGTTAPSNRIALGFIGVGKQATGHLGALVRRSDVNILAICDVQEERRAAARDLIDKATSPPDPATKPKGDAPVVNQVSPWATQEGAPPSGNTGAGPATRAADVKYYSDYHELLARKDVDAVLIATPDHWHALIASAACAAGKDVYCEKPLTLTIREAKELIEVAHRYGRVFQTGSQQRSSREFRFACEMVRSGRIGKLQSVTVYTGTTSVECDLPAEPIRKGVDWETWLGPAPYRPFNKILCPPVDSTDWAMWRLYRDYSGGAMTDFGAHHFDIAQWAMDADDTGPVAITPPSPPGAKEERLLTMTYANGVEVRHASIGANFGGKGLIFEGTEGKIGVDRGWLETAPRRLKTIPTHVGETFLYKSPGHHEDWLRAIRARTQPICPVDVGAHSATVCHLGNICYWLNRPLKWDPVKWEFINDDEANRWVDRPKRAPYTV
jgi:predicted dehydrogenase